MRASLTSDVSIFIILVLHLLFFFNDTATTEIYTLSLHDALPISSTSASVPGLYPKNFLRATPIRAPRSPAESRSEEHTSELQSQSNLVCRLLLEKKKCPHVRSPSTSSSPWPQPRLLSVFSSRRSD